MQNKIYCCPLLIFILICFFAFPVSAANKPPQVGASTACVVDVATGQVLYNKHMHTHRYPASTTKILTAIIAIEEGNLDDTVKVSKRAAYQEGSSIWLEPGEKLTLRELIYGIMLASGNDAAVAIAEHISGSVEKFAKLMNKKAKEMGATDSNFLNPNGLPQSGHYSTAYDLAMIMRYALHNKTFRKITATKHKTISWDNHDWGRGLRNHNELLWTYDGITGGKTGYTRAAGRCLVSSARRNGREVVTVVMNSPSDWMECSNLMDYGLDNFVQKKAIKSQEKIYSLQLEDSREKELLLIAKNPVSVVIPKNGELDIKKKIILDSEIKLPVKKGDKIGEIEIIDQQQKIGSTPLLASNDVNFDSIFMRIWYNFTTILKNFSFKKDLLVLSRTYNVLAKIF